MIPCKFCFSFLNFTPTCHIWSTRVSARISREMHVTEETHEVGATLLGVDLHTLCQALGHRLFPPTRTIGCNAPAIFTTMNQPASNITRLKVWITDMILIHTIHVYIYAQNFQIFYYAK